MNFEGSIGTEESLNRRHERKNGKNRLEKTALEKRV
jgi:hypothetical protein